MLTAAVLLQLIQPLIVQVLLKTELFKLPLQVHYGLLDPLLALVSRALAHLSIFLIIRWSLAPRALISLLLDSVYLFLEIE